MDGLPRALSPSPYRALVALGVLAALGTAAAIAVAGPGVAELRVSKEPLPPHTRFTGISADPFGRRFVAVGARGEVFARGDDGWRRLAADTDADLTAVVQGDAPEREDDPGPESGPRGSPAIAVGSHGTVLLCRRSECASLATPTTRNLGDLAFAGEQAFAVGDRGTVLHIVPDGPARRLRNDRDLFRVDEVDVGVTDDLRRVTLRCDGDRANRTCVATVFGAAGALVEGRGQGSCDDGHTFMGMPSRCHWVWNRVVAPGAPPRARDVVAPVHLRGARSLLRRERRVLADITAGPPMTAHYDGETLSLRTSIEMVDAAHSGGIAMFVAADGEIYLAE